ncbi:MAG: TonB-dependent receptor [Candidatus Cryptobacteroides sp.]
MRPNIIILSTFLLFLNSGLQAQEAVRGILSGRVRSDDGEVAYAPVCLKDTPYGGLTDERGRFSIDAPAGEYLLVVSAVGYETLELEVSLSAPGRGIDLRLNPLKEKLDEAVVVADGVSRATKSAFNAVDIGTGELRNSTKNLSEALSRAPGLKLRESGGVGSDMSMMLDGFSGKHIKVFIDGVPQEGVGESFGLNNIPVNFAEHIEVYKGVVPVGFGTDALGGVINIVTGRRREGWSLDASYSYGSFNTHKSSVDYKYCSSKGFLFEINAFQNYSDNNYKVDTPVEVFNPDGTTMLDTSEKQTVRRFNDTYHNEAVSSRIGVAGMKWADRLVFGFIYSQMYKEIQTGVVQKVVFGQKHRRGRSFMPSLEYRIKNLFTEGLDLSVTANYNRNNTRNIDTSAFRYNWLGEKKYHSGTLGEQSYQNLLSGNDNWNATLTLKYHIGNAHSFILNNVFSNFRRENTPTAGTVASQADEFAKLTRKNITGLSYTLSPSGNINLSVFGKFYNQFNSGPVSASASGNTDYVLLANSTSSVGYGAAGTYFLLAGAQVKLSYERAFRLPANEELFGDEDLELGYVGLRPEKSDNFNFNLSYDRHFGRHGIYAEGSLIFRDTRDYIQRRIGTYTGNKSYASYQNHGKVRTYGYTVALRYTFSKWFSLGGNVSHLDVRDNVKTLNEGSAQANLTYRDRIPNQPYLFANSDVTFQWKDCGWRGCLLSLTYDNYYQHSFPLYSESLGSKDSKELVPSQLSHNVSLTYSIRQGRFNFSFECRNFTDEKLYDNFSLQKPGRAFYGKFRLLLGRRK